MKQLTSYLQGWKDGLGKGSHDFTVVVGDESQRRNSSLDLGFGKETEDSKHSKTSVVDFFDKSSSLGFLGLVLAPAEGVEEVKSTLFVLCVSKSNFKTVRMLILSEIYIHDKRNLIRISVLFVP